MRLIVAGPSSVFTVAPPRPGKCLTVVATPRLVPAARSPRPRRSAAASGSLENAREASAAPPTLGTSATGASVTLTPAARRSRPAASASARTVPAAAWSPAARSGPAHGRIRTSPPSWSTHTSGAGSGDARRRLRVSARSWPGETTLSRNRITPAARPSPQHPPHVAGRLGAGEAQDHHAADLLLEREPVDGRLRASAGGAPPAGVAAPRAGVRSSLPAGADHRADRERRHALRPPAGSAGGAPARAAGGARSSRQAPQLSIMPHAADNDREMPAAGYDLEPVLRAVARTTAACLGFRTTVINLHRPAWDDFQTVVVEGSDEARDALLGQTSTAADWAPLLDDALRAPRRVPDRARQLRLEPGPADLVHPGGRPGRGPGRLAPGGRAVRAAALERAATCSASCRSTSRSTAARPTDERLDLLVGVAQHAALALEHAQQAAAAERQRAAVDHLLAPHRQPRRAPHDRREARRRLRRHPRRARLPEGVRGARCSTRRARSSCAPPSACPRASSPA